VSAVAGLDAEETVRAMDRPAAADLVELEPRTPLRARPCAGPTTGPTPANHCGPRWTWPPAGATALRRQATDELAATGGRPRNTRSTGVEALSPSERRIARLAAEGNSNRDIAQALFVTTTTVEVHLSACLRKLGITSRTELAAFLR
jgi:DNA-binding CsgD family transcriptional regulator